MTNKDFVNALKQRRPLFGTLATAHTPEWPALFAAVGLDFVFLDLEHIPMDRVDLSQRCRHYEAMHIAPVVRIPSPDPYEASKALDGGACAVVAPYIESAQEVERLVGAVKYNPLKGERLHEALEDKRTLEPALADYLANHSASRGLIINIESVPALEALDDLLSIEGVDAILMGPHDLSCSLGIPEQYNDIRFEETVSKIIHKALTKGISIGAHVTYQNAMEQEMRWVKEGLNLLIHSADSILLRDKIAQDITRIKEASGQGKPSIDLGNVNI